MKHFTKFQNQKGNAAGLTLFQARAITTPPFVFGNNKVVQIQVNENNPLKPFCNMYFSVYFLQCQIFCCSTVQYEQHCNQNLMLWKMFTVYHLLDFPQGFDIFCSTGVLCLNYECFGKILIIWHII